MSNFHEILMLYHQGGINFLGIVHTLYRGLLDNDTLKEIVHRSGRTSATVMGRGFNVSNAQVNGSGDNGDRRRPHGDRLP